MTYVSCVKDPISALAEPNRRRLIELLTAGERTAGDLAAQFDVSRPAVSQHLAVLVEAGLVAARKDGRQRFYRLVPAGMADLRAALDRFWTTELDLLVADATSPPHQTEEGIP